MPEYPEANLPKVALLPASPAVLGAMTSTPSLAAVRPVVAPLGVAGIDGSIFPQMSKANAACHVCPTVGCTAGAVLV